MSGQQQGGSRAGWRFVPLLYFLQGLPYQLVQTATTVFFAAIRVPVDEIGHASSALALPWTLKPLWSPLVELHGTRRAWIVATQAATLAGIAALAWAVSADRPFEATVAACALVALASATHDVAADGFYLVALDPASQARFVGVRSACFRLAMLAVGSGVVVTAGRLGADGARGAGGAAWSVAFGAAAALYAAGWLAGLAALPRPAADRPVRRAARERVRFREALASYFRQPGIAATLAFILLYRFGESMITKMAPSFLLAPAAEGGLARTTEDVGVAIGTVGVAALIAGGVLGGIVIARLGLRRCLWPMALAMHAPNLLYLWAAYARPSGAAVALVVGVENLGYGFGFSAYLVYLMHASQRGAYPTTHYAISTGLMGLGAQAAGYVSGDVVAALGWPGFFLAVALLSVPSMLPIFFVPLDARAERPAAQPAS